MHSKRARLGETRDLGPIEAKYRYIYTVYDKALLLVLLGLCYLCITKQCISLFVFFLYVQPDLVSNSSSGSHP